MGCCTRFRRTWIPGYNSDVINPDKAFDFERRLVIFKKLAVIVVLLALLIGFIYLVVYLVSSTNNNSGENVPTVSSLASPNDTRTIKSSSVASVISPLHSPLITPPPPTDYDDHSNGSLTPSPAVEIIKNNTHHHDQNNSGSLCSSSGDVMQCIALSKSFKTIMTFNSTSNHTATKGEGYVLVKLQNNIWHPYCYSNWTLDMAYKLCNGLGFKQLVKLQTIGISVLQQRITQVAKDVSLDFEGTAAENPDLLVLATENSSVPLKTNASQFSCSVGYISCD